MLIILIMIICHYCRNCFIILRYSYTYLSKQKYQNICQFDAVLLALGSQKKVSLLMIFLIIYSNQTFTYMIMDCYYALFQCA